MTNSAAGAPEADIQKAARLLKQARHAVVFTGAGISTPSGIPDFRTKNTGLWERHNPMEVASIGVFQSNPQTFYNWLRPLLNEILNAAPNQAHIALAEMESAGIIKAVVTQNIDNLHQRAGSKNVYEVHGSLRTLTCSRCGETFQAEQFKGQLEDANSMPQCGQCKTVLKPDITLFGEMLPYDTWVGAEEHCQRADVILVAGSSLEVHPAASLPEIGIEHGAELIIINIGSTYLDSSASVLLPFDVASILPKIAALL
jgi:NAD-dependent deacetylase